ncbi:MAG: hypothetical protein LBQ89_04035 [Treponema sp.]|nr:hypothetical protein [Treponema sp.]
MQVELNARGNGACPHCSSCGNCQIQETLVHTLDAFSGDIMELVIYSCPFFNEKN